jgi:acetate kinase
MFQVRKWIGAFTATLGGMDTFVFSGGIGEYSPVIRSRICEGLGFLGIELEEKRNKTNAPVLSTGTGQVVVRVIHTDEELMRAKTVSQMIKIKTTTKGVFQC